MTSIQTIVLPLNHIKKQYISQMSSLSEKARGRKLKRENFQIRSICHSTLAINANCELN